MTHLVHRWVTSLELAVVCAVMSFGCDARPAPEELGRMAEAPAHFEAKRLKFSGTAKPEYLGVHSWRNSTNTGRGSSTGLGPEQFMFVMPVVDDDWSPDEPVPLWLTASSKASRGGDPKPWLEDVAAALAAGPLEGKVHDYADREPGFRTTSGWQKAIEAAEAEHGIVSDPHAPVVMWSLE